MVKNNDEMNEVEEAVCAYNKQSDTKERRQTCDRQSYI